jgi:hypothetical protein
MVIRRGLWETVGMATKVFSPSDLVINPQTKGIVFQVVARQVGGEKLIVQEFDVSRHKLVDGAPSMYFLPADLVPFKEDASQAAARIVREATKD